MPTLQTTSIVDFLKGRGFKPQGGEKFPLFEQRKQLFNEAGLKEQLGEFRGSAEQNTALLNRLSKQEKTAGVSITTENIRDILKLLALADLQTGGKNISSIIALSNFISPQPGAATRTQLQQIEGAQTLVDQLENVYSQGSKAGDSGERRAVDAGRRGGAATVGGQSDVGS